MHKVIWFVLLAVLVLSACAAPTADQLAMDEGGLPVVTVYRPPT